MIKKRKAKTEKPKEVIKKPVSSQDQYDQLEKLYKDKLPKHWDELNATGKLDWFAHRMLLDQREEIRQEFGNDAAREGGFLSDYQLERRRRREVQSKIGDWSEIPPHQGVFGRKYVDPNVLRTGRKPEEYGQKN
jgi:hypothetical protein